MDWVRPAAIWAMAPGVSATGPPSPMFSPASVQSTPAAVSRLPIGGSPRHWWESPQPPAIRRLCADELASRPEVIVSAGSPAAERAWLISASTCAAAVTPLATGGAEEAADAECRAPAVPAVGAAGRGAGEREDADTDGSVPARRGGIVATVGGAAMAIPAGLPAQGMAAAAPHPAAVARGLTAVPPDAGLGENTLRVKYKLPPISTASASTPDSRNLTRRAGAAAIRVPRSMPSPPTGADTRT